MTSVANEFVPPVREDLVGIHPYGAPQLDVEVLLNLNENPFAPSKAFCEALGTAVTKAATDLHRYPDRDFTALRTELARYLTNEAGLPHWALTTDMMWAGNGSNEVMTHVFGAFGGHGRKALTFAPTYSMYPEYARDSFTEFVVLDRQPAPDFTFSVEEILSAIEREQPTIVVLASPNNPTGTSLPPEVVGPVCAALRALPLPGVLVVDEAYGEFRREGVPSAVELLPQNPNLIVTRTMSKAFALAGARLGYLAAHKSIVDALMIVRLPYHLSAVTQAVALTALQHADELMNQVHVVRAERDQQAAWLREQGFQVADSDANFLLFGAMEQPRQVWEQLLAASILIREVGPKGWLRVTIGTPAENARFREALTACAVSIKH